MGTNFEGVVILENLFLIGIGHRARQGKDTISNFIKETKKNVIVYHFADPLKEEVINKERKIPLIFREKPFGSTYWYSIWNRGEEYITINEKYVEFLHKIFEDRGINIYWGMEGNGSDNKKDSLMLQFWGTQWRRDRFGEDYWVNRVDDHFRKEFYDKNFDSDAYFILPDTRFLNEVKWIKQWNSEAIKSFYIKVVRYNSDGTPYYDPMRDKNHDSEINLENKIPDFLVEAKTGELDLIKDQTLTILNTISK